MKNSIQTPEKLKVSPGTKAEFTLTIKAPTQAKTLLAIKAVVNHAGRRFVVSEIIGLERLPE